MNRAYRPAQLVQLSLVILLLLSSFSWSFVSAQPTLAQSLTSAHTQSQPAALVKPTDASSQLQFDSSAYTTTEGAPDTLVTVNRTGSSAGAITATVVLTDVTTTPADYQFVPPAGDLDPTFNPTGHGFGAPITELAVQNDGKILVGTPFATYNGVIRNSGLTRVNPDGSLDPSFTSTFISATQSVNGLYVKSDGKILVSRAPSQANASPILPYLVQLNADGSLDTAFNAAGAGTDGTVGGIAVQSDGKIVIAGNFTTYNGVARKSLARLNADGSLDSSFAPAGTGLTGGIAVAVAIQPDNQIVIGGSFTGYNGTVRNSLARLNPDGSLDPSLATTGTNFDKGVNSIAFQSNGKILVAGAFTTYNGIARNHIARFTTDGLLDPSFAPAGTGPNDYVSSVAVQASGQILIAGSFTTYNRVDEKYIARINPVSAANTLSWADGDSSTRSFVITATDDLLSEGTESAVVSLTELQGDAIVGSVPPAATFTIADNDPVQLNDNTPPFGFILPDGSLLPIKVQVIVQGSPAQNRVVTFTTPTSGPSLNFTTGASYTGTSDVSGLVTTTKLYPNNIVGSYHITATTAGLTTPLIFTYTNAGTLSWITLTGNANPVTPNQNVTFTATINTSPATSATGVVTFTIDGVDTPVAVAANQATYTTNTLKVGNHAVTATYGGDTHTARSTATINQLISANSQLSFSSAVYTTTEGETGRVITVNRTGSSTGAVAATVILTDVTTSPTDYQIPSGTGSRIASPFSGQIGARSSAASGFGPPDIKGIAIQPDGKIVVGGGFGTYAGINYRLLARLNPDGTVDTSFNPGGAGGVGLGPYINSVATQSDGKILIGGFFFSFNGVSSNGFNRLNADGTVDTSFNQGKSGPTGIVQVIAVQPDGKYLLAGNFSSYNGTAVNHLIRVNQDGSLDSSFNSGGAGPTGSINAIIVKTDGEILVAGSLTAYNGIAVNNLAQLNPDGTPDTSFNPAGAGPNNAITGLLVQADHKILVSGVFTTYNGITTTNGFVRLNPDWSLDSSFISGGPGVTNLAQQADGKIIIIGNFGYYQGSLHDRIARLNLDGSVDGSFASGYSGLVSIQSNNLNMGIVNAIAKAPDGKIIIGGDFNYYNGITVTRLIRLNPDGSLDPSFNAGGVGTDGIPSRIAVQNDGKIIITGQFSNYNHIYRPQIARLNSDGSLDTSFELTGAGFYYVASNFDLISDLAVQNDGKILVGGTFASYDGMPVNDIARLNPDGSLDTTFVAPLSADLYSISAIAVQNDGKFLVSGVFTTSNNTAVNGIARFNSDSSLDPSFRPTGFGPNSSIYGITVQSDGEILVSGNFANYKGVIVSNVARLNLDGSLDTSFILPKTGTNGSVVKAVQLENDKILIAGNFTTYDNYPADALVLLNGSGGTTLSWPDGDSSPRSLVITATDDTLTEPAETATLSLNYLVNGVTAGVPATATLTIGDNDSPAGLNVVSGNNQTTTLNTAFAQTLVVQVVNQSGGPVSSVPVTFTAPSGGGAAGGTFASGSNIYTGTTDVSGLVTTTTFTANALAGTYSVIANANGVANPASFGLTNTATTTAVSLTSSPNPSNFGQTVTFTATVSPTAASGIVSFTVDGGAAIPVTLSGGLATYTTNTLSVGSHSVVAVYSGDTTYSGATSQTITQLVGANSTALSLASSPNPSNLGQTVTFTATVTPIAASGTVTFTQGASVLGTASLVNGSAVYTTTSLSVGSHVITATYGGDSTYTGATSQPITQVVQAGCQALVVTAITDDGKGTTCGTLSFALSQPVTGTTPMTITFALTQGNTITFTGSLTTTAAKAYVVIDGGTFGTTNRINLNGNGVSGDGLHLKGHNRLNNLTIYGFGARQLVLDGTGNVLQGVKIIA